MICPHCSHENPENRKFCQVCTKPLRPGAVGATNISYNRAAYTVQEATSKMAVLSLVLSFLALIPPMGITAVVLGHISRRQIAKSAGRLKGMGIAFAGLILGYLQLTVFAVLLMALAGVWREARQDLDRHPGTRAALLARIMNGDPDKVTPERTAQHEENTVAALRLIQADERAYLAAHPDDGYSCQFYKIEQAAAGTDSELETRLRGSGYEIKIDWCGRGITLGYAVLAIPMSSANPPRAPLYCLDAVNGILKYRSDQANDLIASVMYRQPGWCSLNGEHVE